MSKIIFKIIIYAIGAFIFLQLINTRVAVITECINDNFKTIIEVLK